jgi:SAM-dependent methyltransferase
MGSSKSILVVAPRCPVGLVQEALDDSVLLNQANLEVLLPPYPYLPYDYWRNSRNPAAEIKLLSSPARRFFSARHIKWLRGNLGPAKKAMLLVPKELYQAPDITMAALLILLLSGRSITILRNNNEVHGLASRAVSELNGQDFPGAWISFEFNSKIIAAELGHAIWTTINPIFEGRSRNLWDLLYMLMFLGLLIRGHSHTRFLKMSKPVISAGGRNPLEMNSSRSIITVAPGCPAGLIQELLDETLAPDQTRFEVLLPPGNHSEYADLTDRKIPSGWVRFVSSPARDFFSLQNIAWLWKKLRSSEKITMLVPISPYQNPTLAIASPLVMLLSGKTITLLRPATEEDTRELLESGLELKGQDLNARWITIKLNKVLLLKELGNLIWYCYPSCIKRLINFTDRELCYYFEAYPTDPANLKPLDASPAGIEKDVEYALGSADLWIARLPGGEEFLRGKRVMEIGPGVNFGAILTLACYGAEVLVVERFSSPWNPHYHPKFYARLRDKLAERRPSIDLTPLDMIISQGKYPQGTISVHSCSLEELGGVPEQSIDLVFSNAVFEHLYDLKSAFAHLSRITKPGGLGLHQVDFRDHRDPSRPLEHLLFGDREFSRVFKEKHSECGNRFRPSEMGQCMEAVGFEVREFRPDLYAEEEYLKEFLGRLRQAKKSRYRKFSAEDLRYISGLFIVVRKPA